MQPLTRRPSTVIHAGLRWPTAAGPLVAAFVIVGVWASTPTAAFPRSRAAPADAAGPAPHLCLADVAREAYVWGWPLEYVNQMRKRLEHVRRAGISGGSPVAPLNRLSMLTDRIASKAKAIPCPNQDVLYGFGMFDLQRSAVVLQVPHFGDRFWLFQLGDQRTDGFAELGRIAGSAAGAYLVVGPTWDGRVPPGIVAVLRSPTRYAYCIPRVGFLPTEADRRAAAALTSGVMAYPVDEFDGRLKHTDWSRLGWLPDLAARRPLRGFAPDTFLAELDELVEDVAPLPGEEPLYERLRWLLRAAAADPDVAATVMRIAETVHAEEIAPLIAFRHVGRRLPGHWTTIVNGAAFQTDYRTRAAVARSNVFVNRHHETKYYYLDVDADGRQLDGSRAYRITFPTGSLPPARAFWSLTSYDAGHALPTDPAGRTSIGSRDLDVTHDADGSLSVMIGPATDDAGGTSVNRLAAPPGPFCLCLRLYWPEATALDGTWLPPAVIPLPPTVRVPAAAAAAAASRPGEPRG